MPEKSKVNRFQTLGLGLREDESAEHSSSSFLRKVQEIAIIGAAAALAACGGGSSGTTSPPPIEYTVSATASPTAGGTIQGAGTYQQGEQATLTEKPNAGYSFEGWSGPGYTGTSPTASFMVNGNETEIATFQQQTFTLSVTANPSNDGTVTGNGTYDYGQTETITATPASGYTFAGWSCSGAGCYDGSNATATVTMDANIQETANFQQNTPTSVNDLYAVTYGSTSYLNELINDQFSTSLNVGAPISMILSNPKDGNLYYTSPLGLGILNPSDNNSTFYSPPNTPAGNNATLDYEAFSPDYSKMYFTLMGSKSDAAMVFDTGTHQFSVISLPFGATSIAVSPDGKWVAFGNNWGSNTPGTGIALYNTSTGTTTTLNIDANASGGVSFDPTSSTLWVTSAIYTGTSPEGLESIFNLSNLQAAPTSIAIPSILNSWCGSPALFSNGKAYVGFETISQSNLGNGIVAIFDSSSKTLLKTITNEGEMPDRMGEDPDGNIDILNVSTNAQNNTTSVELDVLSPSKNDTIVSAIPINTFQGIVIGPDGFSPVSGAMPPTYSPTYASDGKTYIVVGGGNSIKTATNVYMVQNGAVTIEATLPGYSAFTSLSGITNVINVAVKSANN